MALRYKVVLYILSIPQNGVLHDYYGLELLWSSDFYVEKETVGSFLNIFQPIVSMFFEAPEI